MTYPIMAKATAVWLIDNTTLTFRQVSTFTGLHELEVLGIADGEVAQGIKGFDPVTNNQLTREEIEKGEKDAAYDLRLKHNPSADGEAKRRGPRYTPLSKRQDRPAAIAWLVKFHPELADAQISKLVGTTKPTIQSIRERTHWNISQIQPIDPVALGLCRQIELDEAVRKAAAKQPKDEVMSNEDRAKLLSTSVSLTMDTSARLPSAIEGLETFSLAGGEDEDAEEAARKSKVDADSLFNLPDADDEEDAED